MFSTRSEVFSAQETIAQPPPAHVAIIMDGNGRWARARRLPRVLGHKKGAEAVRGCVAACSELGISYLTLYAFSSENWKRPAEEVGDLMGLLRHYLRNELAELKRNNVRLRCIGARSQLSPDIVELMEEAEEKTAANTGVTLLLALNYGGRAEIVEAARQLAVKAAAGSVKPDEIDDASITNHLHTADIPDPDIIIRTSGEKRLSNFLLWQGAYAELIFIEDYWPDFTKETLLRALAEYGARDRRYGARSD